MKKFISVLASVALVFAASFTFSETHRQAKKQKLIDLSVALEHQSISDPVVTKPTIDYQDHTMGAQTMIPFFPGLNPATDLPNGLGWAVENVTLSTHSGTHLDAPWHYHPTTNNGEPSPTIDQIPLEWCMGNGVKVDFRHLPDGYNVQPEDFEEAFQAMHYRLRPGDIVLVNTAAGAYWGKPMYPGKGCGMGKAATLWLLNKGVKVVGTDAWSWDRPLTAQAKEFAETGDSSLIWEGHFASIEKMYLHYEKLTNLDKLPAHGFKFVGVPVKIKAASGGWSRPFAILEEDED